MNALEQHHVDLQLVNAWKNGFNKAYGECIFIDERGLYAYEPIKAKDFAVATGAIVEVRKEK